MACIECGRVGAAHDDWTEYCPRHQPREYDFCSIHGFPQARQSTEPYDRCPECCIDSYIDAVYPDERAELLDDIEAVVTKRYRDLGLLDRYRALLDETFAAARADLLDAHWPHAPVRPHYSLQCARCHQPFDWADSSAAFWTAQPDRTVLCGGCNGRREQFARAVDRFRAGRPSISARADRPTREEGRREP